MKIRDLMTKSVASCITETNLAAAGALMWESDCGFLPVVDEMGKVTGVLTDRDICIALATSDRRASGTMVGDVVKSRAILCDQDDDILVVLKAMQKHRILRLPVVNKAGLLEGIVSLNDIVLRAAKSAGRMQPEVSVDDVVQTLQTICSQRSERSHHAAPGRARTAHA
ncbi:MAG TPA: CBS domain-containing protein [Bryobacteraceae bacterium]|jgi:CBS domain-containing protein|nr:CBS domain-containing protein [Bryobacteraceae bacterium]